MTPGDKTPVRCSEPREEGSVGTDTQGPLQAAGIFSGKWGVRFRTGRQGGAEVGPRRELGRGSRGTGLSHGQGGQRQVSAAGLPQPRWDGEVAGGGHEPRGQDGRVGVRVCQCEQPHRSLGRRALWGLRVPKEAGFWGARAQEHLLSSTAGCPGVPHAPHRHHLIYFSRKPSQVVARQPYPTGKRRQAQRASQGHTGRTRGHSSAQRLPGHRPPALRAQREKKGGQHGR